MSSSVECTLVYCTGLLYEVSGHLQRGAAGLVQALVHVRAGGQQQGEHLGARGGTTWAILQAQEFMSAVFL